MSPCPRTNLFVFEHLKITHCSFWYACTIWVWIDFLIHFGSPSRLSLFQCTLFHLRLIFHTISFHPNTVPINSSRHCHHGHYQFLRRIECMRYRLLLLMCALSVSLSVTWLNSASLCGGHSVQPLPNHCGLLFACCFTYRLLSSCWLTLLQNGYFQLL